MYCELGGDVCGEIGRLGHEKEAVCIVEYVGRVVLCSCVMISVFLHFEDVFGRRNQGTFLRGGTRGGIGVKGVCEGLHSMCEEGELEGVWERCNCARRS